MISYEEEGRDQEKRGRMRKVLMREMENEKRGVVRGEERKRKRKERKARQQS